jgi:hypothetical protein
LRFNGDIELSELSAVEIAGADSGTEELEISISQGDIRGEYSLSVLGYVALQENEYKQIRIRVRGVLIPQTILVQVIPDRPDFSQTVVLNEFDIVTMTDSIVSIRF